MHQDFLVQMVLQDHRVPRELLELLDLWDQLEAPDPQGHLVPLAPLALLDLLGYRAVTGSLVPLGHKEREGQLEHKDLLVVPDLLAPQDQLEFKE